MATVHRAVVQCSTWLGSSVHPNNPPTQPLSSDQWQELWAVLTNGSPEQRPRVTGFRKHQRLKERNYMTTSSTYAKLYSLMSWSYLMNPKFWPMAAKVSLRATGFMMHRDFKRDTTWQQRAYLKKHTSLESYLYISIVLGNKSQDTTTAL